MACHQQYATHESENISTDSCAGVYVWCIFSHRDFVRNFHVVWPENHRWSVREMAYISTNQRSTTAEGDQNSSGLGRTILSNSRRRDALAYLGQFGYPVELRTLATHTVAAQNNLPVKAVDTDAVERMVIRLHHLDIPVLSAAGFLAYDAESRLVVYTATDVTGQYADTSASKIRQLDISCVH